ncbi:MAG: hypothetical protein ABIN25_01920, partial [Ginsengibacter sp.]
LSNIDAICITDINHDNKPDIIAGGNKFNFPPQIGRLDASFGDIMINTGNNNFSFLEQNKTGLHITGEIKDIQEIKGKHKSYILFTVNNQMPQLFQIKNNMQKK